MDHEQIIANQTILRDMYEGFGEVRQARPAATFEKTPSQIIRPAPKLGEHSKEILKGLGISEGDTLKMISDKIIGVFN
jgi:crotonobetainyl-CoA:carnitine CoA-transferase CaiB-like acyl-CoA transferase